VPIGCCSDRLTRPRGVMALLAIAMVACLACADSVSAISIRHDKSQSDYEDKIATAPFNATGRFDGNISATLIGYRWLLRSAHGGGANSFTNVLGDTVGEVGYTVYPGDPSAGDAVDGFDFALADLVDPMLSVDPVGLYTGTPASLQGQTAVYAGSGKTGTGLTGATGSRTLLAGTNVIDTVGLNFGDGVVSNIAASDFDLPIAGATPLEMGLGSGDSGGGLFVMSGGQYRIAGVHSAVSDPDNDGILGEYLHANYSTLLTDDVRTWINNTIGAQLRWTGDTNDRWNTTNKNFDNFGSSSAFVADAHVLFDDRATQFVVDITTAVDQAGVIVNTEGAYTFTGAGTITGGGELYKTGGGSLTITNANTFTGGTIINQGTLIAHNTSGSATGPGDLEIRNGGTLSGDGHVDGHVTSNGAVVPTGSFTQSAIGSLDLTLAATNGSQLMITGNANLAGTLAFALDGGNPPGFGDSFDVITASSITGSFALTTGLNPGTIDGADVGLVLTTSTTAITVTIAIAGDANLDNVVSFADFLILQGNFGLAGDWSAADFNHDGVTDFADFQLLEANFGYDGNVGALLAVSDAQRVALQAFGVVAIPEPGAIALIGGGVLALIRRRTRS